MRSNIEYATACTPADRVRFPVEFVAEDRFMSVPGPNHPCWVRLAKGGLSRIKTDHLATQLMAKRLERSVEPVADKAAQIHAFFARWERILTNELQQLPL